MSKQKSRTGIGGRIFLIRTSAGLTQDKFAKSIGIKANTLSDIETGKYPPSDMAIKTIALRYATNEHWLLTGEGEMFAAPPAERRGDEACCLPEASGLPPETRELVSMAVEVLGSGTKYARLLAENIRSFHEAIQFTKRIESLEGDLAETRQLTIDLVERLTAIEIAERERIKAKGRVEEGSETPASSPADGQKTAG